MMHPSEIMVDDLQQVLDLIDEKTPTLRLAAAIAYHNGIMQSGLAEKFGVEWKTSYNWIVRLED